jgi:hypothetical protein
MFWKASYKGSVKKGDLAGAVSHNYYVIMIDNVSYMAHYLIWVWHHGEAPDGLDVDHKDGNTFCNTIENLRLATRAQNNANSAKCRNAYGVKGVYLNKASGKYQVQFNINGKKKSLGYFKDVEEAKSVAIAFHKGFYGEFSGHLRASS